LSKDLARWMRPLSILVLIAVGVSIVMPVLGAGAARCLAGHLRALGGTDPRRLQLPALARRRERVVWLATRIFVSIVNVFISLLNLFSSE